MCGAATPNAAPNLLKGGESIWRGNQGVGVNLCDRETFGRAVDSVGPCTLCRVIKTGPAIKTEGQARLTPTPHAAVGGYKCGTHPTKKGIAGVGPCVDPDWRA